MLNTLIVGCGNIAGRFDANRADVAESPLTHAGSYRRDGRFRLSACVEPDLVRREDFMQRWNVPRGYESIEALEGRIGEFDVISICSPTTAHAAHLRAAARLGPRLVFCEKPLTGSSAQSEDLIEEFRAHGIPLAVNYTRRWDPSVLELKSRLAARRWGPLRTVVGSYNRGLLNNGSHMLDLLLYLFGDLRTKYVGTPVHDHAEGDPSVPAWFETGDGIPVVLTCTDARDFAHFELEFVFAGAIVRMEEGGLYWRERPVGPSAYFGGYRVAGDGVRAMGGYGMAMRSAVANLFEAIAHAAPLASSGTTALATQRLCEQLGTS
jgi:predicted dehydrogenase